MSLDITIHDAGKVGVCALSNREGEGIVVTFKDGTIQGGFLSQKAFFQLLKMKFAQQPKPQAKPAAPAAVPTAIPAGNSAK